MVVVGGGPTGLMLAAELTLAGTDVVVVERRPDQELDGSRAGGLHARTLEVLDQRGVVDRFLAEGQIMHIVGFAGIRMDISDFPTRHPYGLALWQRDIERILAGWVDELDVPFVRGEVVGVTGSDATGSDAIGSDAIGSEDIDDDGVVVTLADGRTVRGRYVVGCDGGRSVVRKTSGIEFPGTAATTAWLLAEVEMTGEPPVGMRPEGGGIGPVDRERGGSPYGVVLVDVPDEDAGPPTMDDVRTALVAAYGSDFGAHDPIRISRFDDATRQAATYRSGRVLLAGDAAHVHPPQGGQGLNVGVQDAVNLGWKLAQVVDGRSPESLLDTYHAERHPVGAGVLHNTRAQVAVAGADDGHLALRDVLGDLLAMDQPRRTIAAMMSGLDVRYDTVHDPLPDDAADPDGEMDLHPLVGRRMPDLDLRTDAGATRVYELLHGARPLLLDLRPPSDRTVAPLHSDAGGRVDTVRAATDGPWELPVVGAVPAPTAVLVRPDGHVAAVGDPDDPAVLDAIGRWFGAG